MTPKEINSLHTLTIDALERNELKTVFDNLIEMVSLSHNTDVLYRLERLEETYRYMLHYFFSGANDPNEKRIHDELVSSLYDISDTIRKRLLMEESASLLYSTKRLLQKKQLNASFACMHVRDAYNTDNMYQMFNEFFCVLWADDVNDGDDLRLLKEFLSEREKSGNERLGQYLSIVCCIALTAFTFSLQEEFNRHKLLFLFDAADSSDIEIKVRALVGVLLIAYKYPNRVTHFKEIKYRLDALGEAPDFNKFAGMITRRFIMSKETEKLSARMQDEVLPEMLKLHPKYDPDKPFRFITPEDFDMEANPEWMDNLSKSRLQERMEEMHELHKDGADVMHFSFTALKNFPFFKSIANWFVPFKTEFPPFEVDENIVKPFEILLNAGTMCNSDLFSFLISMKSISEKERSAMISGLEEALGQMKEEKRSKMLGRLNEIDDYVGQYIQDLFRFYKLFERHSEFDDIFNETLDFHNVHALHSYFTDDEELRKTGELYFRREHFEDARFVFERLAGNTSYSDETLLEKLGYCLQKMGDYEGAIENYMRAELINSDSKWLMRHTAQCYRSSKQPDKALDYYFRCDKAEPDNIGVLLGIGACYLDLEQYDEALKYYYKVDYLEQNSHKAWRPVAWCSFITGKFEQAQRYYRKIIEELTPNRHDYLNAGHVEWALSNLNQAVDYYVEALKLTKDGYPAFRREFNRDFGTLLQMHVNLAPIAFVMDEARYRAANQ